MTYGEHGRLPVRSLTSGMLFLLLASLMATAVRATPVEEPHPVLVIAHRGASGYLPEHTLAAYAMGYAMGADYIEPDVVASKDGVAMVLHDITLERTTNVAKVFPERARADGRFYVMDFTAEELASLHALERRAGRFPGGAHPIPRFAEVVELVLGLNRVTGCSVGLYPELKAPEAHREAGIDLGQLVLGVLAEAGLTGPADPVLVQSFDPVELRRVREELGSHLRLIQLVGGDARGRRMLSGAGLAEVAQYADGLGLYKAVPGLLAEQGGRDIVAEAHALGLQVHLWTLRADDLGSGYSTLAEETRALLASDVDGVFTDHPDQVLRAMERRPELPCTRDATAGNP